MKLSVALVIGVCLACVAGPARARSQPATRGRSAARAHARASGAGRFVAVQPFEGTNGPPLRALVSRIVRGRGFHAVTSLPHYEGTGQYPSVARDHHLAAFVTGGVEERGKWSSITFLVWNGTSGSVIGRWTAGAPTTVLAQAIGRGFWQHLGPAVMKAETPAWPMDLQQAPPMRIDASNSMLDGRIAAGE